MGLIDAAIGIGLGAYGSKPKVPDYAMVDPAKEASKALKGNLANFGLNSELASKTNDFNQNELMDMLRAAAPGYDDIQSKASGNILSMLSGELPKDVQDAVQSSSAAKALSGGFSGTGMHGNLNARDLGLTSLDLTQKGLSSAQSWIASTKATAVPGMFDVSGMFISPSMQLATTMENNSNKFQRNWLQSQINAMPDPNMAALAGGMSQDIGAASSAVGSYYGVGKSKSDGGSL